jgi:predicted dehydrogenase
MCGVSLGVEYMNRYERAFAAATQHFVRLVAGSEQAIVIREQVLLGAHIAHAATESARTGVPVRM